MIREATIDDIPRLLELAVIMHLESRYKRFDFSEKKVSTLLEQLISNENGIVLVAGTGHIVGGILAIVAEHFFGHDKSSGDFALFVDPEHRNFRTVAQLIKAYINKARELGAVDIGVGNTSGYKIDEVGRLYETMGFTKVGGNYRIEITQ